jgi:glycosyltransferase 2 family protein
MLGTYWGRALRWSVFLRPLKPHPSIRNLLSATVVGFTAITLFGRPGEFVRPYLIARKEQVPVTSQFAAWVLERLFDLLMALILFAFALTRVQSSGLRVGANLSWVLSIGGRVGGALAVIILLILLSLRHFAEPLRIRLLRVLHRFSAHRAAGLERIINALFQGVESMRSDSALVIVLLYSVLEWLLICLCYVCLANAFAGIVNLGMVDVLILMGFVSFGSVVQIPGVGGGMQVVSVLVLTELFGVRLEPASAFALFLWAITFVVIVPIGMLVAVKEGLDWHSLKRIGREASE